MAATLNDIRQFYTSMAGFMLLLVAVVTLWALFLKKSGALEPLTWEECNITRYDAWKAMENTLDINKDGFIDTDECMKIINLYFEDFKSGGVVQKIAVNLFLLDETTVKECAKLTVLCDADNDGRISEFDFNETSSVCVKSCTRANMILYQMQEINKKLS